MFTYTQGKWDSLVSSDYPIQNGIITIRVDKNNRYWLGIPNYGFVVHDNGNFSAYNDDNSFYGIGNFNSIAFDKYNKPWIVSSNFGVFTYSNGKWVKKVQSNYGIPPIGDTTPFSIACDSSGSVYIGSNSKVGYFPSIHIFTSDTISQFLNWCDLPLDSTSRISYLAAVTDKENKIWFGCSEGLLYKQGNIWGLINKGTLPISFKGFLQGDCDIYNNKIFVTEGNNIAFYNENGVVETQSSENETPLSFVLNQNYPNPFNPSTSIEFSLPNAGYIRIVVYNTLGEVVSELANGNYSAGNHSVNWNVANTMTAGGVYFYKFHFNGSKGNEATETKKMIFLK